MTGLDASIITRARIQQPAGECQQLVCSVRMDAGLFFCPTMER